MFIDSQSLVLKLLQTQFTMDWSRYSFKSRWKENEQSVGIESVERTSVSSYKSRWNIKFFLHFGISFCSKMLDIAGSDALFSIKRLPTSYMGTFGIPQILEVAWTWVVLKYLAQKLIFKTRVCV